VSQPPLSRQIRSLEAELKVKLLDRNTQEVRLTRIGCAVLARSRKLVRDAESLRAEAQMIEKESQEELRIGYAPSPTAVIISRVLSQYHELSPGGRLTLHDLNHTEMLSGLKAGKRAIFYELATDPILAPRFRGGFDPLPRGRSFRIGSLGARPRMKPLKGPNQALQPTPARFVFFAFR